MTAALNPLLLRELTPVHFQKQDEEALQAKRVSNVALPAIEMIDRPHSCDDLDPERVSLKRSHDTEELPPAKKARSEPNLAWEAIQAALAYERHSNKKLDGHLKTAEGYQRTIDSLLDLSAELTSVPDQETHTLSEEAKTILKDLKLDSKESLTKEELLQLKSTISARIDQHRSKVQTLVTTDIHTELQNASSINDIMKEMIKQNSRLLEAIIARYARQ